MSNWKFASIQNDSVQWHHTMPWHPSPQHVGMTVIPQASHWSVLRSENCELVSTATIPLWCYVWTRTWNRTVPSAPLASLCPRLISDLLHLPHQAGMTRPWPNTHYKETGVWTYPPKQPQTQSVFSSTLAGCIRPIQHSLVNNQASSHGAQSGRLWCCEAREKGEVTKAHLQGLTQPRDTFRTCQLEKHSMPQCRVFTGSPPDRRTTRQPSSPNTRQPPEKDPDPLVKQCQTRFGLAVS